MRCKKDYLSLIKELCPPECQGYCFFKVYFEITHLDERTLIQMKCLEIFKYEEGERVNKDIGWDAAILLWVERGHAKRFAEVFNENLSVKENYRLVVDSPAT